MGKNKIDKKLLAFTSIEGCRLTGDVKFHKSKDGAIAFERLFINDSLHTGCTVTDRFLPANGSIRWEVEVRGNGRAWSAPIKTVFNYPAGKETRFWTTWGQPKYDSSIDGNLREMLKAVPGASPESSIVIKSDNDWVDPLIPVPFINDTLYYGAPPPFSYNRSLVSAEWTFFRQLFSVPLFSVLENKEEAGIHVVLSPEDNILSLAMTTDTNGAVTCSRLFNRISSADTVRFSLDLIAGTDDWRPGLEWMSERYPAYFNPENPAALELNGTGAYSNYYKDIDAAKMKEMAFTVNWQASFDFPYMGMFLPPVQSNEKWKRFGGGEMSIADMNEYAGSMRKMGFYVLNYFNVTEFGARIRLPYTGQKLHADADLWKDANEFLFTHFPNAILYYRDKFDSLTKDGSPFHTWGNALVMDCGDSAYHKFLLDQARRHVAEIPNSYGICIDRLDWLNIFNIRADDGISWYDGKPVRAINVSYKRFMDELGPIMHNAGKYILANSIGRRIDYFKHLDGIFDEFTYSGTPLNTSAFICINKPALGWTDDKQTVLKNGGDNFFQKYLYMGVFPMCPYPGNDHSLESSDSVKQFYRDYAPLMKLMRKRKWVLSPHVVSVKNNAAKANVFSTPDGYVIPVVYGRQQKVQVAITLPLTPGKLKCFVSYPGIETPAEVSYTEENNKITVDMDLIRGCGMLQLKTTGS